MLAVEYNCIEGNRAHCGHVYRLQRYIPHYEGLYWIKWFRYGKWFHQYLNSISLPHRHHGVQWRGAFLVLGTCLTAVCPYLAPHLPNHTVPARWTEAQSMWHLCPGRWSASYWSQSKRAYNTFRDMHKMYIYIHTVVLKCCIHSKNILYAPVCLQQSDSRRHCVQNFSLASSSHCTGGQVTFHHK